MKYKPRAASNPSDLSTSIVRLICGGFLVAGLVGAYFLTYVPMAKVVAARGWEPTPCVILTSRVREGSSSFHENQKTYAVDMTYSFEYGGQEYVGRRYNLEIGTSSNPDPKVDIMNQYPPGTETTCYVDPEDPFQSVVDRSPGLYLLWGLLPLPFILGGLGGMLGARFFTGRTSAGRHYS